MDKRYVLMLAAGIAAGVGGALLQSKKSDEQPQAAATSAATKSSVSAASPSAAQPGKAFYALLASGQLKQPDGASFSWKPAHKLHIINFWATWCAPCVEEMPELDRLSKTLPAQSLIGVAIDNPSNVKEFLQKTPVTYPIALAGLEGTDLLRELGNNTGGLPFTLIMDGDGKVLFSKMGKTNEAELKQQLK